MLKRLVFLFGLIVLPLTATAEPVCVSVDEKSNGLNENDRKAVLLIARGTFSKLKVRVVEAPCQAVQTVGRALDRSIIASVKGPKASREGKAESVEALAGYTIN